MRSTRFLSLAALVFALANFPLSPARAEPEMGPGAAGDPGGRFERMIQQLGLDGAQQRKVQAILDAAKPQREEIRARIHRAFAEMHALLDRDSPDEAAVLAQADRLGAITTEAHKAMLRTLLAVRAELTPEQRAKLKRAMREYGPEHSRHPQHGGPPEGPPEAKAED